MPFRTFVDVCCVDKDWIVLVFFEIVDWSDIPVFKSAVPVETAEVTVEYICEFCDERSCGEFEVLGIKVCCTAACVQFDCDACEFSEICWDETHGMDVWRELDRMLGRGCKSCTELFIVPGLMVLVFAIVVALSCQAVVLSWITVVDPSKFGSFVDSPLTFLVKPTINIPPSASHRKHSEATSETVSDPREKCRGYHIIYRKIPIISRRLIFV